MASFPAWGLQVSPPPTQQPYGHLPQASSCQSLLTCSLYLACVLNGGAVLSHMSSWLSASSGPLSWLPVPCPGGPAMSFELRQGIGYSPSSLSCEKEGAAEGTQLCRRNTADHPFREACGSLFGSTWGPWSHRLCRNCLLCPLEWKPKRTCYLRWPGSLRPARSARRSPGCITESELKSHPAQRAPPSPPVIRGPFC